MSGKTAPEGRRRIGYVDYDLDNFHSRVYLKILRGELADRGYEISGAWTLQDEPGRGVAAELELPYCSSCEELSDNTDFFMILAPNRPDTHLELCQKIFPFGKTTYVDKTFAPDAAAAEAIFQLADRHGIAMQTSSALRYTNVQEYLRGVGKENLRHMVTWGSGRSFDEYAIHPVELAVSCLGDGAVRLMRRGQGNESQLLVDFSEGRTLVVNVFTNNQTPYAASLTSGSETKIIQVDSSRIFVNLASAVLDFFESGQPDVPREETLTIMRLLDAARDPGAMEEFVHIEPDKTD